MQKNKSEPDNTRKIMMRKYGLTEGTAYVETHTLLEPNNFIPSWEAGDEEKKEVSNALLRLRKDYDLIHKQAMEKDNALIQLKADIKKAQEEERLVNREFGGTSADTENSSDYLTHLTTTHNFQNLEKMSYNYMLDRMKRDLISLTLTINDLTESLRSKKGITEDEMAKLMKARETKL